MDVNELVSPESLPATRMLSLILVRDSLRELRTFLSHLVVETDAREDLLLGSEIDDLEECEAILRDIVESVSNRLKNGE